MSSKVVENEILVLDQFSLAAPKTKEMVSILKALNVNSKAVIVTADENTEVALSARNIPGVKVLTATSINVLDLLDATKLVITKDAVQKIEEVLA